MPDNWQGLALEMLNLGYTFGVDVNAKDKARATNESRWSLVGLALLLLGLSITFFKEKLNAAQAVDCSLLISAGLAALLVNLPGFLELQGALKPNEYLHSLKFKGTGAVAIFVLTFLITRAAIRVAS